MNVMEFVSAIGSAPPASVYLFCPEKAPRARQATFEPFLAGRAVDALVNAYVDPATKDMCYAVLYADETPPKAIAEEARTFPFLAERRVIVVRNADLFQRESFAKPLLEYLASPSETTLLIFVAAKVDKRTKFYKACQKAGELVGCPQLSEREVKVWIKEELDQLEKAADPNAIQELVDRTGIQLSDVHNAVTLVSTFVGDECHRITQEDVVKACGDVSEEEIWALTDAIASSQVGKALCALRNLTDLGKQPDEIMGTINWLLTSAYAVANGGEQAPISRFVAQKVGPLAQKLGLAKIRDAFRLCTDTHFSLRSTGVNGPLALELLVVKLAAPRRKQG